MLQDVPSVTAYRVALRRAAHQVLDRPVVFDDPLALAIAGVDPEALRADPREQSRFGTVMRAFVSVRSRFAEDQLAAAVERGVDQYVVLGAGLDTFAYRSRFGDRLRVFEIDYPATQAWKRQQLAAAGISVPASLTFVPVDFERQNAFDELRAHGLDARRPAWFTWLGVTMYLENETVWSVLRQIAALPSRSGVAFDYAVPTDMLGDVGRRVFDELSSRVARTGEPFRSFIDPHTLLSQLHEAGFSAGEDVSGEVLNQRYFAGRSDGLRVGRLTRMACAMV
jgi:methyltransferase (TIGR00027 family)